MSIQDLFVVEQIVNGRSGRNQNAVGPTPERAIDRRVEERWCRDEARRLRQQAREALSLAGSEGPERLSQEGRQLLYRLSLLLIAASVQLHVNPLP
jgi:hypothetical protein